MTKAQAYSQMEKVFKEKSIDKNLFLRQTKKRILLENEEGKIHYAWEEYKDGWVKII